MAITFLNHQDKFSTHIRGMSSNMHLVYRAASDEEELGGYYDAWDVSTVKLFATHYIIFHLGFKYAETFIFSF